MNFRLTTTSYPSHMKDKKVSSRRVRIRLITAYLLFPREV